MLIEVKNVRQLENERFRRWFSDDFFELIVWFNPDQHIHGFQLCYDIYGFERALTWKEDTGYLHNRIDGGENSPMTHKMSPILVADGLFDSTTVAKQFKTASSDIEPAIADFVYSKLQAYPETSEQ